MGLGICQRFAELGHPVAMLDVQQDALDRESAALKLAGANLFAAKVDVADRQQVETAYAAIRQQLGPIGIIVANAGISEARDFLTMSLDTWQRMMDVNLNGVFHTIQAGVGDMVEQGWGRIVTISSNAAQWGAADRAHYSAAKGGVIGLTKALARELARHSITVNTIPPSLVDTPLARRAEQSGEGPNVDMLAQHIPIARAGTPEDIAYACEFLCSDGASYITGQEINVNGGIYS